MTQAIQTIISTDVALKMYDLIQTPEDSMDVKFLEDEEIINRLHTVKISLLNHEETVNQNRQLQSELNRKQMEN